MMPHHFSRTEAGWKEHRAIEMAPPRMLADVSKDEDVRLNGFVQGMSVSGSHISLGDIPWGAWARTFAFWLPLVVTVWIASIGLAYCVVTGRIPMSFSVMPG